MATKHMNIKISKKMMATKEFVWAIASLESTPTTT